MAIAWDTSLSVGIDAIDDDHKKLLDIINMLGSDTEKSREELTAILNDLVDYTRYHFEREEDLMAQHGYASLEKHQEEHGFFIAKLMDLGVMLESEDLDITREEASAFLSMWLTRHIRWSDFDYVSCVTKGERCDPDSSG